MTKKEGYFKESLFGIIFLVFVTGLVFWFTNHEPGAYLKIILIGIITVVLLIFSLIRTRQRLADLKRNIPVEDELSTQVRLHAGAFAFQYSMYLWLVIFFLKNSFSDTETMLGIGILGSGALYGLCWVYFNSTGNFNENPN